MMRSPTARVIVTAVVIGVTVALAVIGGSLLLGIGQNHGLAAALGTVAGAVYAAMSGNRRNSG